MRGLSLLALFAAVLMLAGHAEAKVSYSYQSCGDAGCTPVSQSLDVDFTKMTVSGPAGTQKIGQSHRLNWGREEGVTRQTVIGTWSGNARRLTYKIVLESDYHSGDRSAVTNMTFVWNYSFDAGGNCTSISYSMQHRRRWTPPTTWGKDNWSESGRNAKCSGNAIISAAAAKKDKKRDERTDPSNNNQCLVEVWRKPPAKAIAGIYRIKLQNRCKKSIDILVESCHSRSKCEWSQDYVSSLSTEVIDSFIRYPAWKQK